MTIYLDVVLLENLCMNYIILFATGYILKLKLKHIRIIASAFLGGMYSLFAYMEVLKIYSNFILKIILSVVMVYIAYNAKNIKQLIKQLIFFYLTSFVFGGCAFALLYIIKPQEIILKNGMLVGTYPIKVALLGGLGGFAITTIAFNYVKNKIAKKDIFYQVKIFFNEKQTQTTALLDTGNMLKDPISGMPVIIVEKEMLKDILPEIILNNLEKVIGGDVPIEVYENKNLQYISKFRLIPFSSLGKENGMLLGFKASKIEVVDKDEERKVINNVIVGIYDKKLSKKNQYFALIGLDLLEGSEVSNESIANASR